MSQPPNTYSKNVCLRSKWILPSVTLVLVLQGSSSDGCDLREPSVVWQKPRFLCLPEVSERKNSSFISWSTLSLQRSVVPIEQGFHVTSPF